jgi:hypothetical protein
VRALAAALRSVRDADRSLGTSKELPLEEQLIRAETLARTWQHMRRTPDARILATRRLRNFALARLPDPAKLARDGHPLGTHLSIRVRDARSALGAESELAADNVESLGEYEALGAWMNYRHGRLRQEAETAPIDSARYHRLRDDHLILGADGDAARVLFLPGAPPFFTWRELSAALRTLDVTPLQRIRFASSFAVRRLLANG